MKFYLEQRETKKLNEKTYIKILVLINKKVCLSDVACADFSSHFVNIILILNSISIQINR